MFKLTDFAIIVSLIFLPFSLYLDVQDKNSAQAQFLKQRYSAIMKIATEDATKALLAAEDNDAIDLIKEFDDKKINNINPNLDLALARFYETVFSSMNIKDDRVGQDAFKFHVPLKMIVGFDGYYLNVWERIFNSSKGIYETAEVWTQKKAYAYYDDSLRLIVNFTLSDYVYVYNCQTGSWDEGFRDKFEPLYPGSKAFKSIYFDNIRKQTIINYLQKELEYCTYKYNRIAKQLGKSYTFNVPIVKQDDWNNTIDNVSFIAFLQGMPLSSIDPTITLNTFGFGGSKIDRALKYYGDTYNGRKFYHTDGCSILVNKNTVFDNRKDAAKEGYYPCPYCKP